MSAIANFKCTSTAPIDVKEIMRLCGPARLSIKIARQIKAETFERQQKKKQKGFVYKYS